MFKRKIIVKYWVWSTTEENFEHAMIRKLHATRNRLATKKVSKGDIILFYTAKNKKSEGMFRGLSQVSSNWKTSEKLEWPDEIQEDKKKWPYQCKIKPELIFKVKLKDAKKCLSFIKNNKYVGLALKNMSSGPANGGKPIPPEDIHFLKSLILFPFISKHFGD